jgi:enoyl-CoA hydratase
MTFREDHGGVVVLRLAHGKVNALDLELCESLAGEVNAVASSAAEGLVITGTGSAFSAGVDLFRVLDGGADYLRAFLPAMETLFMTLLTFPKPVIAAINGHAIAGGCIMAAACDYRVMVDGKARIGVPELLVGVPFPALPFEIVRARASAADFRQLVLSGRTVLPDEARALGLVDDVAPGEELMGRAFRNAQQLIAIPPVAFALTKRTLIAPILENVARARSLNDDVLEAWANPSVQARMRAYVEQTVGKK